MQAARVLVPFSPEFHKLCYSSQAQMTAGTGEWYNLLRSCTIMAIAMYLRYVATVQLRQSTPALGVRTMKIQMLHSAT